MRKRFEQQMSIGTIPIGETRITTKKRSGPLPALCAALKEIFTSPEWNEQVFAILESKITADKKRTGRPGMDLWQIFVLSQVRLCMNISYDDLHDLANNHALIRQIMGVEKGFGHEIYEFEYQNIVDNVGLLDDEAVRELNQVIVEFGHGVFKKKRRQPYVARPIVLSLRAMYIFPRITTCYGTVPVKALIWWVSSRRSSPGFPDGERSMIGTAR